MVMSGSSVEGCWHRAVVELRSAFMKYGALSVTMAGMSWMQELCVDSWGISWMVSMKEIIIEVLGQLL